MSTWRGCGCRSESKIPRQGWFAGLVDAPGVKPPIPSPRSPPAQAAAPRKPRQRYDACCQPACPPCLPVGGPAAPPLLSPCPLGPLSGPVTSWCLGEVRLEGPGAHMVENVGPGLSKHFLCGALYALNVRNTHIGRPAWPNIFMRRQHVEIMARAGTNIFMVCKSGPRPGPDFSTTEDTSPRGGRRRPQQSNATPLQNGAANVSV